MRLFQFLVVSLVSIASSAYAQVASGRITGRVTDASGALVAGAAVKTVKIQGAGDRYLRDSSTSARDRSRHRGIRESGGGEGRVAVERIGDLSSESRDGGVIAGRRITQEPDLSRIEVVADTEVVGAIAGVASATFGQITGVSTGGRIITFLGKLTW